MTIAGVNKIINIQEALGALDYHGVVLSVPFTGADAGSFDASSDGIAGYLEAQVIFDGVVDTCWIGTRRTNEWRPLPGASPYTVQPHDVEFLVEVKTELQDDNYFLKLIPRAVLRQTSKRFLVDANSPETLGKYAGVNASINAAGTELTVAIATKSTGSAVWTVESVQAR